MRIDLDWQHREGRDSDGDKFRHAVLVHGSGRILAKVYCPLSEDEYVFKVVFLCTVPGAAIDLRDERAMGFMDVESAKRFAEEAVAKFSASAAKAGGSKVKSTERDKVDCAI